MNENYSYRFNLTVVDPVSEERGAGFLFANLAKLGDFLKNLAKIKVRLPPPGSVTVCN